MGRDKRQLKTNIGFLALFLAVFMLCFMFSPMAYILNKHLDSSKGKSNSQTEENDGGFYYLKYPSILINLPEKEYFKEVFMNGSGLDTSIRSSKRSFVDKILPVIILGLSVGIFLLSIRKTDKNKTVIDFIVGGHAPPFRFYYQML